MSGGLLIAGRLVPVAGVNILPPTDHGGPAWCHLDSRDYRLRRTAWVRQVVVHSTKGDWPQHVIPGAGPEGRAESVARFWADDPTSSGAHIVIDGHSVACLVDLASVCAYHATVSNEWSVGIELYQEDGGGIADATYENAVRTIPVICNALGIPFQLSVDHYDGHPLQRLLDGGPDVCAIYGHRSNTEQRGRGDPGDEIFMRLLAAGAEGGHLKDREDLELGRARQPALVAAASGSRSMGLSVPSRCSEHGGKGLPDGAMCRLGRHDHRGQSLRAARLRTPPPTGLPAVAAA